MSLGDQAQFFKSVKLQMMCRCSLCIQSGLPKACARDQLSPGPPSGRSTHSEPDPGLPPSSRTLGLERTSSSSSPSCPQGPGKGPRGAGERRRGSGGRAVGPLLSGLVVCLPLQPGSGAYKGTSPFPQMQRSDAGDQGPCTVSKR